MLMDPKLEVSFCLSDAVYHPKTKEADSLQLGWRKIACLWTMRTPNVSNVGN